MRKARGKTTGYVLVPLFVEQAKGETIEEALGRTEFDEVWNVLQAMQEQDDLLAEIIRQMREERGRTKGFDDTRFRETVEILGPQISLEALRDSITTACIETFSENWDEKFGELQAFKDHYGHCSVPSRWPENKQLGMWVSTQRLLARGGKLRRERTERLSDLGFIWDPFEAYWEEMFSALVKYQSSYGNCNVPAEAREHRELGKWVNRQRMLYRRGSLTPSRINRFNQIGFVWKPVEAFWEEMFAALTRYKEAFGDCNVPFQWAENRRLGE